ncbi:hypothetical protein [Dyadobacter diqingensis]|uniref:hypothetical protein n=1 Tax=Dyadobacter diqingensis TaxID=2938121 RepID=UPI0020C1A560|nr:hypothetical protein [Dyadobacter diqingensis]
MKILESETWLSEFTKASIFSNDALMGDLVVRKKPNGLYESPRDLARREGEEAKETAENFRLRAGALYDHYLYLTQWSAYTTNGFRNRMLTDIEFRKDVAHVLADYLVTTYRERKFRNKIVSWICNPYKGNFLKLFYADKPSKAVVCYVLAMAGKPADFEPDTDFMNRELCKLKNENTVEKSISEISETLSIRNIIKALRFEYFYDIYHATKNAAKLASHQKSTKEDIITKLKKVIDRKQATYSRYFNDNALSTPFFENSELTLTQILLEKYEVNELAGQVKALRTRYLEMNAKLMVESLQFVASMTLAYKTADLEKRAIDFADHILEEMRIKIWNGTFGWNTRGAEDKVLLVIHLRMTVGRAWHNYISGKLNEGGANDSQETDEASDIPSPVVDYAYLHETSELLLDLYLREKNQWESGKITTRYILAALIEIIESDNFHESFLGWYKNHEEISRFTPASEKATSIEDEKEKDEKKAKLMLRYMKDFNPNLTEVNLRKWISMGKLNIRNEMERRGLSPQSR